jgi:hypothetical protein
MPSSTLTDYRAAVQAPGHFRDRLPIDPVYDANGQPYRIAGGLALVFKLQSQGRTIALQGFYREVPGHEAPEGVYFYTLRYQTLEGDWQTRTGTVTLVR